MKKIKKLLWQKSEPIQEKHQKECGGLDENSLEPKKAWKIREKTQTVQNLRALNPATPISKDKLRIVCTSDTHEQWHKLISKDMIPNGDVLIHTGDITLDGDPQAVIQFDKELGSLSHTVKLVIAGNHDYCLDRSIIQSYNRFIPPLAMDKSDLEYIVQKHTGLNLKATNFKSILRNCIYLEDSMVSVCGVKIYGTPWVETYTKCIAFSVHRGEALLEKWNDIPDNIDILMTHTPPLGYGDVTHRGHHVGCVDLLNTIQQRVQPKYHIYGHIHEGYGIRTDGTTTFINCALCTRNCRPHNLPIVFDYPLPEGYRKSDKNWVKVIKEIGPPPQGIFCT